MDYNHNKKTKGLKVFSCGRLPRTVLCFLACTFTILSAAAQRFSDINVNVRQIPLSEVLAQIERQTGYRFLYNDMVDAERKISVRIDSASINDALNILFKGTGILYTIQDRQIVLRTSEVIDDINAGTVFGVVRDTEGNPVSGAAVVIKGSSKGVNTDNNGKYSITANADDFLIISFLGYEPAEIRIGNRSNIDVILAEGAQEIEQVVVIGYGSIRRKELTGSVSTINGAQVADRKNSQLSSSLQGSMPGVMVTRSSGAPGAQSTIRVRGITTIGDSSPLIIVDGVPADNINDINPNDVESITALKDAASASIYGSRAAAGVILVTTKRAKANQLNIEYTFEYGVDRPTRQAEYVDVIRYMEIANELGWNDAGNGPDKYPVYSQSMIENYMSLNAEDPDTYPNTDWQKLILKKTAPKQTHVFSISGGTDKIRTKATFGYDKVDGLHVNRSYERFTVRMNNDVTVNRYLSAGFDINVKRSEATDPVSSPINGMRLTAPVYAALWSDGRIASGKSGANPYAALVYGGTNVQNYNQLGGKAAIYLTPVKGLKISAIVSPTYNDTKKKKFTRKVEAYTAADPTVFEVAISGHSTTILEEERNDSYNITKQFFANYDRIFGSHSINLMAGYEDFYTTYENLNVGTEGMQVMYPYMKYANLEILSAGSDADHTGYMSFFGRAMYSYKNKYLLQFNIRRDASSRFDKKYRAGVYPSFSAGWVLSEEKFFNVKPVSFLKFRGSYGTLGNERIGNHPYLPLMNYTQAPFYNGDTKVIEMTAAQWSYAIRDISWETTKTMGLGLDAAFFGSRLNLTADYYYKITKDMLLNLDIPDYVGFDDPERNTGKMKTTGFEIELGWNDRAGDFTYGVTAHVSDFKSVMGYLGGTQFLGDQVKMQGSYYNEWYGYKTDGLFQTQEEIDNYPTLNANVKPGDIKYLKADSNDTSNISPDKDRVLLGNSQPRYQYGATLTAAWKGIDLNIVLQGVGYQLSRIEYAMVEPYREGWGNTPKLIDGKYWSNNNTAEENLNALYPRLTRTQRSYNAAMSDYWLFNGAYFRLKNITLGYTLPSHITEKIAMKRARFYISANDILCISNYPKGWDPEMSASAYPIVSSILFGLSVNF